MGTDLVLFYLLAIAAVAASVFVVGQRNPIYSIMGLIGSFVALSGLYVLLNAPFAAVTQIIIYAGAILVLFLFVVMLLNNPVEDHTQYDASHPLRRSSTTRAGIVLAVVLVGELVWALSRATALSGAVDQDAGAAVTLGSVREIGVQLFTKYQFAFEATSILILVAMVGAVVLARREDSR